MSDSELANPSKALKSANRSRQIARFIVCSSLAWFFVVQKLPTPARVPDTMLVGILLGLMVWIFAWVYLRRWSDPGIWMFLCIGLADGLFLSGLIHFGGPLSNRNPTRWNILDNVLTVLVAAWGTHALVPAIVANFRLSRRIGRTFGGRRARRN